MIKKAHPLKPEHGVAHQRWAQAWAWAMLGLTTGGTPTWSQTPPAISATQLPQGGKVVAGTATIGQSGNSLNINQSSNRAVLNWNSFNVGAQAQVNFVQPSANSVTLNRVLDTQASQILGRINANGQVFLSNPNGVLFGPSAQVDVGGLLVTTHGIGNDDFMAGKSSFEGTGKAGSVVNQGQLQASLGGYIALLAPQVRNEGVIVAKEGTVALAAGDKVTLQFAGQSLTAVQVDRTVVDALVDNQHLVRAEGGYVVMTARSANALLQNVVKNTGSVQAPSLVNRQGRIVLEGGSLGRVEVAGSLSATGDQGLSGGSVWVMGDQVLLSPGAAIDTSGDTGGGQVLIGGGWSAAVGPVGKSSSVHVVDGVSIKAAATGTGNGGYVETSAKKVQLAASARVDTSARHGTPGQWVIDPVDITIDDAMAVTISNALNSGNVTVSTDGGNTPDTSAGESSGTGDINVDGAISWSANLLTLKAADKLYINNVLRGTGSASLRFHMTAANGLDNVYYKAPVYLPAGDTLSALEGASLTPINIKVITSLGSATSTTGSDLQGIGANLTGWFALGSDIDASASSTWNAGAGFAPLGNNATPFDGVLLGQGHVISNLTINRPGSDYVGLLGKSIGHVSELGLVDANITGRNHVGSLVGMNTGTAWLNFATGQVSGATSVGGLVGTLGDGGKVRNSYAKANVSVTNFADAGGLIGLVNVGTVYNSYATGQVSVVGAGSATGVGGLIGRLGTGALAPVDVSNAGFWDTTLSGQSTSAAGVGLATTATKRYNSGLDQFNLNTSDYWLNYYNKTTPLLQAFLTPVTIMAGDDSKTYDGQAYNSNTWYSTSVTTNGYLLGNGSMVFGGSAMGAVNAGTYTIVPSGLYSDDNRGFAISYANGTLTVDKANVSLTGNRAYNGSTAMAGANLTANGVNGETFSVTGAGADGNLSTRHVQAANLLASVSGLALGTSSNGGLSSNYNALSTANSAVTITAKPVTLTAPVISKAYDGNANYTPSDSNLSTLGSQLGVVGDTVSAATMAFDNKSAAYGTKVVTLSAATVSDGNGGQNYSLTYAGNSTSTITPKALTIIGITAADKVYDGLTTASVSTAGVTPSVLQANGLVAGDTVTVSSTGNFRNVANTANDKNAATNKTVLLSNTYGGADVGNYAITGQTTTTANITPLALSVTGLSASDKSYDGSTTATLTGTASISPLGGDTVNLQAGQAQFASAAEGANQVVTASGYRLTGTDANNYQLTQPTSLRASITPLDLTPLRLTLTPQVMATLNGAQVASLSPDQVSYLSTDQFGAFSASQLANLSPAAWSRVSTASVAQLTPTQIASLRADAWANWLASQVRVLRPDQLQALTPTQLAGWGSTQLQAIDNTQWAALSLLQRQSLTAAQISAFTPNQVAASSSSTLSELTTAQIAGLVTAQITRLSPEQINAFTASQWQSWSRSQIAALTPTQIAALTPSRFAQWSTVQLAGLNAAQVASISLDQINALSTTQLRQLAASGQLQQIVATDVARVVGSATAASAIQAVNLNAAVISATTVVQTSESNTANESTSTAAVKSRTVGIGATLAPGSAPDVQALMLVTSGRQISQLSILEAQALLPPQLKLMNGAQLDALVQTHGRSLLPGQWASLSAQQLASLSPRVWASLDRDVLQNLTAPQLSALTLEQVTAMRPAQLAWLTPSQWPLFNRIPLSALSVDQFKALISNKLAALPPEYMPSLTQAQWLSLSRNQIQSLTLQQIQLLTPAQLAALPPPLWSVWSVPQVHMLAPPSLARIGVSQLNIVIKHLLPHQIQALDPVTLVQLEPRQWANLTPLQWSAITPNHIAAFSPALLNALTPAQLQWLSPSALSLLSGPQLAALSPALIASFTPLHWQNFSPAQWQALQSNQLASLSLTQLESLGPRVLLALTPTQLAGLNLAQRQVVLAASGTWPVLAMSPAQISAMSTEQIQAMGVASMGLLTPAQAAALQARQLQALSLAQWQAMAPAQLAALQPELMNALPATVLRAWGLGQVAALSPQQVQAMSVTTLGAFTPAHWQALSPNALAALTAPQWRAVPIEQMGALTTLQLAGLPLPWLGQLQPAQIQALNLVQMGALTPAQLSALTPAQMQWLTPAQLSVITPQAMTQFTPVQMSALSPVQVASFSPAQVNLLTPLQMRALAGPQLQAMQPAQIVALQSQQLNALTPAQIQLLTPLQLQALSPAQVVALNPTQLQALSPAQWNALRAENMAALNTAQLQALSPPQIAAFNPTQITVLEPAQISTLLPPQVAALGTAQIWSLSNAQLQALTPSQIGAIRSVPLGTLLPLLRAEQIQGLSKAQLASINPNQLRQLTNAQTQAVLAVR